MIESESPATRLVCARPAQELRIAGDCIGDEKLIKPLLATEQLGDGKKRPPPRHLGHRTLTGSEDRNNIVGTANGSKRIGNLAHSLVRLVQEHTQRGRRLL